MQILKARWLALSCFVVLFFSGLVGAEEPVRKSLYPNALRASTWIVAGDSAGTGWIVDAGNRLLITNNHVVGTNKTVTVVFPAFDRNNKLIAEKDHYQTNLRSLGVRGTVLRTDAKHDLALIKVESMPATAGEIKLAGEGASPSDRVHSIGNPGVSDALWVYTSGTVRQVYRRKIIADGNEVDARIVETQAPINPGDSGGPVLNDEGELVGVTVALSKKGNLVSLCIDVSEVKNFLTAANVTLRGGTIEVAQPKSAGEFIKRAKVNFNNKDLDAAIADYSEAIKLEPKDFLPYRNRGFILHQKGDFEKALVDLDRAVELNEKDPYSYLWRGRTLQKLNKPDRAKEDLERAAQLDPTLEKK